MCVCVKRKEKEQEYRNRKNEPKANASSVLRNSTVTVRKVETLTFSSSVSSCHEVSTVRHELKDSQALHMQLPVVALVHIHASQRSVAVIFDPKVHHVPLTAHQEFRLIISGCATLVGSQEN